MISYAISRCQDSRIANQPNVACNPYTDSRAELGAPDATSRNFFRQIPRGFDADQFDVRVDHSFTTSNNAFVRFSQSNQTTPQPGTFDGFIGGSNNLYRDILQFVINDTHVFSPTLVNEFRAGYTRHNGSRIVEGIEDGLKFAIDNRVGPVPLPGARIPEHRL